jgi:hypothetical protein
MPRRVVALLTALFAYVAFLPSAYGAQGAEAQTDELPVPAIEEVPAPITQLLADYSRAWRDKDPQLLVSTLDPKLQHSEAKALANAKDVPFTNFDVEATTQFSGNLASPRIKAKYRGVDVATYQVDELSRIGSETSTYDEPGAFTFIRGERGGDYDGWRLVSKSDLDVLGFFSPHHLWDEKPVAVLQSERFVVLTHGDVLDVVRPELQVAESAYEHDTKFWPEPLSDHFVVIAPSTTDELRRIMHETVALEKFVAFVANGADREHGWAPTGPRVFVHLDHLRNYGRDSQQQILAHELIHAFTRKVSGPKVTSWIEEGLANFGGGNGGRKLRIPPGTSSDAFPTDDQFFSGPVGDIQTVYDKAQIAIEVLDAKFGRAGLVRFYEELGRRRVVVGTEEYHVREAVRTSVGWSYDEWIVAWKQRLRNP